MTVSIIIISKDESSLQETLVAVERDMRDLGGEAELVVVDASRGRLDDIRRRHPDTRWIDFEPPDGVAVSIPHQRNVGVRSAAGEIIAFTDCGCLPEPGWLPRLMTEIEANREAVTVGQTIGRSAVNVYRPSVDAAARYVTESATINLAFTRAAFDRVRGFDESFAYGSDIDFTWRLVDAGYRLRVVPDAVVTVDWGSGRRQMRRAFFYGRARARLYRKHRSRLRTAWRTDPVPFAYSVFILGLPLALLTPAYLLLLIIPALRNRETGAAITLVDHLLFGAGFLREMAAGAAV
jgi:glycosyltransferase involved in cell wall biosynthesis